MRLRNDLLNAILVTLALIVRGSQAEESGAKIIPLGRDCLLPCENKGVCEFIADTVTELQLIAQSGGLIQRCRCPPGYGGVVCEIPIETCDLPTQTCQVSERSCDLVGNIYSCHCGVADKIDNNFVGRVCRRGYTEYCNPYPYDPDQPLYFCTNGGKCNSDFLAAKESPSDLAVRKKYMDAGCMCNPNFEGESCEKMKFETEHLEGLIEPDRLSSVVQASHKNGDEGTSETKKTGTILLSLFFVALGVGVMMAGLIYSRRRHKHKQHKHMSSSTQPRGQETFRDEEDAIHDSPYGMIAMNQSTNTNSYWGKASRRSNGIAEEEDVYDEEDDEHSYHSAAHSNSISQYFT